MRAELQALLDFIRGDGDFGRHYGGCVTSWADVLGDDRGVHRGCIELEEMGLIRRDNENDGGRIVWRAAEGK